jgi:hypothetical protein
MADVDSAVPKATAIPAIHPGQQAKEKRELCGACL